MTEFGGGPVISPGWYPDPGGTQLSRWWDGYRWTGWTAPTVSKPWGVWAWVGFVAAVLLSTAASAVAAMFIVFFDSTGCDDPATAAQRLHGLIDLAVAVVLFAAVWALPAALLRSRRIRNAAAGVITVLPLVLTALSHLRISDWSGTGFCF